MQISLSDIKVIFGICSLPSIGLSSKFFFFCLFKATPEAHGSSLARSQIGAVAAGHSHSNAGSEVHL